MLIVQRPCLSYAIPAIWLAAFCLLIGTLLIGFAQLAITPPWGSFDEIAHYSYIQQIADKGQRPRYRDRISAEIVEYLKVAPGPEELNVRWTYSEFFAASRDTIESGRVAAHAHRDPNKEWREGRGINWEAQHPPLYYLLMAPAYVVSKNWSIADQLFLLRGVSYGLAWIGLCLTTFFWFRGTDGEGVSGPSLYLAPAIWPLLFPMWFPEMARLGNDCLVALLAACAWVVLKRILSSAADGYRHVALGFICGLGLLTKATFLPFVAVITAVLLFRIWQERTFGNIVKRRSKGLIAYLVVTVAISGWWYLEQFLETGSVIGSIDMIFLNKMGGLLHGLAQNADLVLFPTGIFYLAVTFLWGPQFIPPIIFYVPFLLTMLLIGWGYIRQTKKSHLAVMDWVPLLTLAGLLAGLFNQLLVFIAVWAVAAIPGYYLHSFAPVLASLVARAIAGIKSSRPLWLAMLACMFFPLFFLPLGMGVETQFFSGCSTKQSMVLNYDVFSSGPCATDLSKIINNLSVLAFPRQAICFFVAGWTMMLCGVLAAVRSLRA